MDQWIESHAGWLKINDDGAILARHPYKYFAAGSETIRAKLSPRGEVESAAIAPYRALLHVHPDTGEIVEGGGAGFNLQVELIGIEAETATCADGKSARAIEFTAHDTCADCGQITNRTADQIYPKDLFQEVEIDVIYVDRDDKIIRQEKRKIRRPGYYYDFSEKQLKKKAMEAIMRPIRLIENGG